MKYNTIHSLGSRCQNSEILRLYEYREFSGFFDFMNTSNVKNIKHILADGFNEILKPENNFSLTCNQMTLDPETGAQLPTSIRTSNKFYDIDHTDVHGAIFPHHDLNNEKDYKHFMKCKERFIKLKNFNTLFNYTFNKWENNITKSDMDEIIDTLRNTYEMKNFRVCFIGVEKDGTSGIMKGESFEYYDVWDLTLSVGSFTGGIYNNSKDNENYMEIIKSYDIDNKRISKYIIDNEF